MILLGLGVLVFKAIEISLGTIKTFYTVKGKNIIASVTSFFEILIWYLVAKKALVTTTSSWFVAISFALGYAIGTLLGSYIANKYISTHICIQAITKKDNKKLIKEIRDKGYGLTIVPLKNKTRSKLKEMYLIETNKKELKQIIEIFKRSDDKAFIIINESKVIE